VIVIGAGVLGLCSAAELAARGHAVTVIDPGGPNASAVAAGMIAPAMESLLEETTPERAALLRRARDRWPAFAETHGLKLRREGAEWRGEDAEAALDRMRALGFEAQAIDGSVRTSEDWRVDVGPGLTALARVPGVSVVRATVARVSGDSRRWRVEAGDGRVWFTPSVVVATGAAATAVSGGVSAIVQPATLTAASAAVIHRIIVIPLRIQRREGNDRRMRRVPDCPIERGNGTRKKAPAVRPGLSVRLER